MLKGKPIDPQVLETALTKLWGTGRFETLNYGWVRENRETGLIVRAEEKKYGPPFLELGVLVNNTSTDDTQVNLLGRLTFQDLGGVKAEWRTDFSLGSRLLFGTEYFRPLGGSRFFVAPAGSYDNQQQNIFDIPFQNPALDGSTQCNDFIGIYPFMRFFFKNFLDAILDRRHAGHAAHQNHLIDILGTQTGVL